jgi:hypothetical protein
MVTSLAATNLRAQGILWEVRAVSDPAAEIPLGQVLAYATPGVAFVGGTGRFFFSPGTWLSRFSMSGQPADLAVAGDRAPAEGNPPISSRDYTAVAAGSGGVYLTGSAATNCGFQGCESVGSWMEFHTAAGGRVWRTNEDGATYAAAAPGVAGAFAAGRSGNTALLVKYEVAGAVAWRRIVPAAEARFATLAAFPGGGVVAGGTIGGASGATALLQRYDEQGVSQWSGSSGVGSAIQRVAVEPAGNVYAAGTFNRGATRDLVLTKYSAEGSVLWSRARTGVAQTATPGTCEFIADLAIDGAGNAVVTGTASTALGCVAWTAKYDPAGNLLWTDAYASTLGGSARARALAVDATNHVFVAGVVDLTNHVFVAGVVDLRPFVRKLGPRGTALWTVIRPPPTAPFFGDAIDVVIGAAGELLALVNLEGTATLMRLDPGPAEPPPLALVQLTVPPGPWVSGRPITLNATIQGAVVPSGTVTFRVNGSVACNAVALQPSSATAAGASCALPLGLPAGTVLLEAIYSGDANHGAASASSTLIVAADATVEVPTLSPLANALLAALVALGGAALVRRRAR